MAGLMRDVRSWGKSGSRTRWDELMRLTSASMSRADTIWRRVTEKNATSSCEGVAPKVEINCRESETAEPKTIRQSRFAQSAQNSEVMQ
jgi:hypothetical protein